MNPSSPHPSARDVQRMRESAEWLTRLSGGALDSETLNDEELAAWIRWYETDPANARAFEEMQTLWDQLGRLDSPEPLNARAREQRDRIAAIRHRAGVKSRLGTLLASFERWLVSQRRFAWGSLLSIGALGVWAALTLLILPGARVLPPDGRMATRPAENREAVLPDGSTVELGAQSTLALEYAPTARYLKLTNGQAYFNVAKDKTRPFAVDTGELKIQAVGTAFDVRKNEGRIAVTVTEGVVDITTEETALDASGATVAPDNPTDRSAPIRVAAGYQLIWDKGHSDGRKKTLQLSHVDTKGMTAWREGRLEYVNEPLSVVIADVNRYSSRRLVIEGADLGTLNFTGSILVDSIDDWLTGIQVSFPVSVREGQDDSLIIRRRAAL